MKQNGFTLVELSIVMIIIGLLIGGIFGGMKLIDNANVQKTIQDLKAIETAALTFRDTYRALPGDIRNPSTRIPNCTVAPCATAGNGNRIVGNNIWVNAIANTDENFSFWHHLQASSLLQMDYSNTLVMEFGEGQPSSQIGGGYRVAQNGGAIAYCNQPFDGTALFITQEPTNGITYTLQCSLLGQIDQKIDDNNANNGKFVGWGCFVGTDCSGVYVNSASGAVLYDLKGF